MFRKLMAATIPAAPDEREIRRLTLIAVQAQQALKRRERDLALAQQDRENSRTPMERQAATQALELLKSELAQLEAELQQAAAAVKRAEAQARLPELSKRKATVDALLPKREPIVAEVDRSNKALAAALEALNNIDEQIYQATAGRERDVYSQMGDRFHLVERRNRLHNSIPLCWPDFIRFKFQSSFAHSIRDKKTFIQYETEVVKHLLARLERELKSIEEEANTNAK